MYDEDENVIEDGKFSGFMDRKKGGIRPDFLEKEAELSGSEVDSDEDEGDIDDLMDEEEGDKEHFDEDELRDEVGKTHWRGELAKDQREVRLLQELYLEDGDLHGEGRQRSFRWKNMDKENDDGEEGRTVDGDESDEEKQKEEDEEESKWRKLKIEREQFLKEQRAKDGESGGVDDTPPFFKTSSIPLVSKSKIVVRSSSIKLSGNIPSELSSKNPLEIANPETETQSTVTNPVLARQASLPSALHKVCQLPYN